METINRREFLKISGLAALGTASACAATPQTPTESQLTQRITPPMQPTRAVTQTPTSTPSQTATQTPPQNKRVLRIAHLTDFHVQPEGIAPEGMARALRHAQRQADPPDVIFNTGDSVMETLEADKASTEAQWEVFKDILEAECKLPIFHAIGNHDVWGWGLNDPEIENDPL